MPVDESDSSLSTSSAEGRLVAKPVKKKKPGKNFITFRFRTKKLQTANLRLLSVLINLI
jgi:hypothetical protein